MDPIALSTDAREMPQGSQSYLQNRKDTQFPEGRPALGMWENT